MHRRDRQDRNARGTRPARTEQTARFLQAIGVDVGPQQGELDQIVLRTATADAFVIPGERRKRLDRAGKIAVFERREATRQRRKVRAGRVGYRLDGGPDGKHAPADCLASATSGAAVRAPSVSNLT